MTTKNVKGQATLDAANARKAEAEEVNALALETTTPESGYEKPKTLRQLEAIVESNALRGAGFWRKAADALLVIKTEKLWRKAVNSDGEGYPSFVVYAEERFGFKKTYAYDLVKAATHKPEAVTEGSAREEMKAEREQRPIDTITIIQRMTAAFVKFEDRAGDLRDRSKDDRLIEDYDQHMASIGETWRDFTARWSTVVNAEAVEVSPLRDDLPPGHDDSDDDDLPTE